jgi:quinol-cytochrome oxidoreductase complex cytochrome b subunit
MQLSLISIRIVLILRDVIGDSEGTKENYKKLKGLTNTEIIPVWQISDSYEELQKLTEESPSLIGVGGCVPLLLSNQKEKVRSILEKVFKYVKMCPYMD